MDPRLGSLMGEVGALRKTEMRCAKCRGLNVTRDCVARWSGYAWETSGEFDAFDCDDCGHLVRVVERWADTGRPVSPSDLDLYEGE